MKSILNAPSADIRTLTSDEMDAVTGGLISLGGAIATGVVMRPDGGTCTDPVPLPTKWPIPINPFPHGSRFPF